MKSAILPVFLPLLAMSATLAAADSASANDRDSAFFQQVEGQWVGPGEIVAGKYKGTRFVCTFSGSTPKQRAGMTLDGSCRVGVFTQKMSASIERRGNSYRGTFMDGAKGKGLDVVSGNVTGNKVIFGLNRAQLKGAMIANLAGEDRMTVTVSVRVESQMIPVIGINLKRVDAAGVGSVARE